VRDKVSGKGFKIRCKKCGHIVVVRGAGEGEAQQPAADAAPASQAASTVMQEQEPAQAAAPDAVGHLVINQDQVGPVTAQEVRERFQSRQIDGETYAWRDGMENWLKLSAIDEFTDLSATPAAAPDQGATIRVDPGVLAASRPVADPYAGPGSD